MVPKITDSSLRQDYYSLGGTKTEYYKLAARSRTRMKAFLPAASRRRGAGLCDFSQLERRPTAPLAQSRGGKVVRQAAISSSPPVSSPTSPFVPPRSFCGPTPRWFAWVSALDSSPLPSVLAARGSSACEPKLTPPASVWWNYARLPTYQEPKEPHRHAEAWAGSMAVRGTR
jgi:hypothetical protein